MRVWITDGQGNVIMTAMMNVWYERRLSYILHPYLSESKKRRAKEVFKDVVNWHQIPQEIIDDRNLSTSSYTAGAQD
jgi:hypothetical protein